MARTDKRLSKAAKTAYDKGGKERSGLLGQFKAYGKKSAEEFETTLKAFKVSKTKRKAAKKRTSKKAAKKTAKKKTARRKTASDGHHPWPKYIKTASSAELDKMEEAIKTQLPKTKKAEREAGKIQVQIDRLQGKLNKLSGK